MRPNNRQRSRGGRNGGGGGGHNPHKQQHNHNPNRPPNRNQIFDSSGPDVRVRGNAHQVFDKYQALGREAAASGDRIMAEAYWQYADHYFRVIQTMGGLMPRTTQGWNDGGEESQQGNPQQQGQPNQQSQPQGNGPNGGGNGNGAEYSQHDHRPDDHRSDDHRSDDHRPDGLRPDSHRPDSHRPDERRADDRRPTNRRSEERGENEPGLGSVAFLQNGRGTPANNDPAAEDQPEIPDFTPASPVRRG